MNGYEKVPDALATDATLSLQARAVYPVLLYEAWLAGARAGERVELPPLRDLSRDLGCSVNALRGYVSELKAAGWVDTIRAARGRPQTYVVHAVRVSDSDTRGPSRDAGSDTRVTQDLTHSRARSSPPQIQNPDRTPPTPPGLEHPPKLVKVAVDGYAAKQDVALNALCEVCRVDLHGNGVKAAVVAMHGRGARKGIRELYWIECMRKAEADGLDAELALFHASGETFERHLEAAVRRKAATIRERQQWRNDLAPANVCDLWLDIELRPAGRADLSTESWENA